MYPTTTAAVRQGCTRSVVLSSSCLVPVICGVDNICDTKHVDVNVRMGWYIYYYQKCSYITAQIGAIYGHAMDMRTQRQHTAEIWGMAG